MKLWIIYKDGTLIAKIIAEMLQDRLENYIDVSVGKASKIESSYIVKEDLDYLIVVDSISKTEPSKMIQKWAYRYKENYEKINLQLKTLSGVLISQNEIKTDTNWVEFIQNKILAERIHPPILLLKLNKDSLVSETVIHELVKEYSNQLIKFIINTVGVQ
jgi:hypothetical protein